MMIELIEKDNPIYQKALELRYNLFFKDHGLPFSVVKDEKEEVSSHLAIFTENNLIAYGRLTPLGNNSFQISQMVVSPSFQAKGYGSQLLRKLIGIAKKQGADSISLNARSSAIVLYLKQGFKCVSGVFNSKVTGVLKLKWMKLKWTPILVFAQA